jgi:EAL domain-containing protein (putative c-di-GMP-specific phosphodiesterase class I)
VSAVQLHHSGFIGDVRRALEKSGLPGELLTVELTESVLIEQHRIEGILESLRALGVGIAIDDFGTGYSSLSYLRRFPVTSVKIDRSFIADLTTNRDDGLVRSIIAIAETFALTTVAEGVETDDQLQLLSGIHCQLAQGYHLGRPQFADQFDVRMVDGVVEVDRSGVTSNG